VHEGVVLGNSAPGFDDPWQGIGELAAEIAFFQDMGVEGFDFGLEGWC
jgi:hypothetical protein